ncbi:Nuclear export factor GLE1 [Carbonactinospora thermoautotrophica]|uniref:Nuclear export factor GLE1 n=1 Tax=Carbonactinospora thermoautotrophica TaxID=1469144 RepID=A0A132ML87_9ACTN|nr:Nuclear export factor GLE1 [Carbonactinospora thermoautotrophica]
MNRIRFRLLAVLTGAVALLAIATGTAAAHVTVNPKEAEQDGYASLTFRVPNERDNASTVKLEIVFPENQPLASVRVKPHPGWSYQIEKAKLSTPIDSHGKQVTEVVRKITWTANEGAGVKPGEFEEFQVSAGRLPKAEQMVFKALQTYDNGEVVRWIEEAAPGATAEPKHPAPVLKLVPKQENTQLTAGQAGTETQDSGRATLALALSVVALLLGAGGLVAAVRRR